MESGIKRNDLIDILLELKKDYGDQDYNGFKFNGDDLMAQAASFFSAGFETSSTTTAFALYELALQPDLQNILRKEIVEALDKSGGKITYDIVHEYYTTFNHYRKIIIINVYHANIVDIIARAMLLLDFFIFYT
ncbi:putative cytochrome P450 6g2 [Formica fusca]